MFPFQVICQSLFFFIYTTFLTFVQMRYWLCVLHFLITHFYAWILSQPLLLLHYFQMGPFINYATLQNAYLTFWNTRTTPRAPQSILRKAYVFCRPRWFHLCNNCLSKCRRHSKKFDDNSNFIKIMLKNETTPLLFMKLHFLLVHPPV